MDIHDNRFLYSSVGTFRTKYFREESEEPASCSRFHMTLLLVISVDWSVDMTLRRSTVSSRVVDNQ